MGTFGRVAERCIDLPASECTVCTTAAMWAVKVAAMPNWRWQAATIIITTTWERCARVVTSVVKMVVMIATLAQTATGCTADTVVHGTAAPRGTGNSVDLLCELVHI